MLMSEIQRPLRPISCKTSSRESEGVLIGARSSHGLVLQSALNQIRPGSLSDNGLIKENGHHKFDSILEKRKGAGHASSGKSLFMTAGTQLALKLCKSKGILGEWDSTEAGKVGKSYGQL